MIVGQRGQRLRGSGCNWEEVNGAVQHIGVAMFLRDASGLPCESHFECECKDL